MNLKTAVTATLICLSPPAFADVEGALETIIEMTITQEMFEGALNAQRPLIIGAVENDLSKLGVEVSDIDRFVDIFFEEFLEEFTDTMQAQSADIYRQIFSETEILDIAAFYRTPSGQAFVKATPQLMQMGAQHGQVAGMKAGQNAMPRLLKRVEREGIEFNTPGLIDRLRREFDL